jgi:hypothetical protein
MKFDVHARMKSDPAFDLQAKLDPIDVNLGLEGALSATIGAISGKVTEIPVWVQIPFLAKRRLVASIGGFGVSIRPIGLTVDKGRLQVKGVVGVDGLGATAKGGLKCETEVDAKGKFIGKAGNLKLNFTEDEEE